MSVRRSFPGSLDALRVRVLTTAMTVTAVAAPLLALVVLAHATAEDRVNRIVVGIVLYTSTFPLLRVFAGRLGPWRAAPLFLALLLGMSFWVQLRGGVASPSAALQLIIVVLSGLLFGARGAALGLAATLATFAIAGFGVVGGYVPPIVETMWDPMRGDVWLRAGLVLTFYGGASALAITYMVTRLGDEAHLLRDALRREEAQREARARAESEREGTRAALAEAKRTEALGRLAGGVAHDYNNALTVIMAAAETAQLSPDLPPNVRSCLDDITQASKQAAELSRSLLVLGRRDVSQPRLIHVDRLFRQLVGAIRRLLPAGIELSIAEDSAGQVHVDPTQLERGLLNLVINARDAIDEQGKIELACRVEEISEGLHDLPAGRYVAIRVRDTGRGMDEEVRRRIFEPFYTTKGLGRGSGIGMALVREFALEASGTVVVDSAPGEGATVTLYLPEATDASREESERQRSAREARPAASGRSILVVEDHSEVLASTVSTLRSGGFEVHEAHDSERALELVDDARIPIDLLWIDGVIPGAGSAKVIERIRARRPATRIVVCSGYVEEELLRQGIRAGELACVRKPFTQAQLLDCIRSELAIS